METKKEIGYIESVEIFADTMKERYLDNNEDTSLIILAGTSEGVQLIGYGDKENRLVSMASAIATEHWFELLVKTATSLATFRGDIRDILKRLEDIHDDDTD